MNENKKKKSSPEGDKIKLVAAVVCGIFVLMDAVDGSGTAFLVILVCAVVIVLAAVGMKKSQAANNARQSAGARQPQREFVRPAASRPQEKSFSKRLTELMRDNTDDCDDDHVHIEPSINADPNEKRAAQLREMLRNGIIEKDEYNILMRKFGLK